MTPEQLRTEIVLPKKMTPNEFITRLLSVSTKEEGLIFLRENLSTFSGETLNLIAEAIKDKAVKQMMANTQRAIDLIEWVMELARLTQNPLHRALGLRIEGQRIAAESGDYAKALLLYDEAVSIHQEQGDPLGEATVYLSSMWALAVLGRYEEAIRKGEWAKKVAEEAGEILLSAKLDTNLALVYFRIGDYNRALVLTNQARALYQLKGEEGAVYLPALENVRQIILCYMGRFQEAIVAGKLSIELAEKLGLLIVKVRAMHNLGITYFQQGEFNQALTLFDQAKEFHEKNQQKHEAALCDLSAMGCLWDLRRFGEVFDKFDEIYPVFHQLEMRHEEAQAILYKAYALTEIGKFEEAILALQDARSLYELEGNRSRIARCDLGIATLFYKKGEFLESSFRAKKNAEEFTQLGLPPFMVEAWLLLAKIAYSQGDFTECVQLLNNLQTVAEENDWHWILYPAYQLLGEVAQSQHQIDEAFRYFEKAITELEQLRGNIMVEHRSDFLEDKNVVYEKMVRLCLEIDQPLKGFFYAERAKSRALIDMLAYHPDVSIRARDPKDVELVDKIEQLRSQREQSLRYGMSLVRDKQSDVKAEVIKLQTEVQASEKKIVGLWHQLLVRNADYARDASIWEVQTEEAIHDLIPENSVLVEYFLVENQWIAFIIGKHSGNNEFVHRVPLDVTTHQIENLLQHFRVNRSLTMRSTLASIEQLIQNAQGILHQLYQSLFLPLEAWLSDFSNVIIVPHGVLHYLPFHALFDGERYLIEKVPVSYLPAASLLRYTRQVSNKNTDFLIMGHSFRGQLPLAVEEAKHVARLLGTHAICEEEARIFTLHQKISSARLLHLACHGDFRKDTPLFSGLALDDGSLTTLDIFNLKLNTSLITLSACQTGRSVIGGGDELQGLMRAFLYAGATSLLLTHWPVSDRSTLTFMELFYQAIKNGETKGRALKEVQCAFISKDSRIDNRYRHPYFWAPFFLVGNNEIL